MAIKLGSGAGAQGLAAGSLQHMAGRLVGELATVLRHPVLRKSASIS